MSTETTKSRIRTFARDLEAARSKHSGSSPSDDAPTKDGEGSGVPTEQKTGPAQFAQAPRDLPEIKREPAPEPKSPTLKDPVSRPEATEQAPKRPTTPKKPVPPKAPPAPPKEPEKEVSKKSASTPIPAFHELQKQAQETLRQEAKKAEPGTTVPSAPEKTVPKQMNPGGYGATVIRDTKHKRFKLFPSIVKSIKSWFAGFKKKKSAPKYTVSDTSRRKGVIQKATAKSGAIFTADNETLKDQIRRRRSTTKTIQPAKWESEVPTEPKAETEQELVWTPNTEAGYALLEEPEDETPAGPQNVAVEFKQRTPLPPPTPEVEVEMKPKPVPEPIPEPASAPAGKNATLADPVSRPDFEPSVATAPPATEPPLNELETVNAVDARWSRAETGPSVSPEPIEPAGRTMPSTRAAQTSARERLTRQLPDVDVNDTNTLTLIITFLIAAIVILGLVAWNYFQPLSSSQPVAETPATPATVYLPGAQASRLTITANQSLVPAIKAAAAAHGQGVVDVQIYNQSDEVVPPPVIIELLQFDVIPSFRQSLTDIRFATVNRSQPLLVFRFTDQTTIRGGFLEWESNLASDLDGLYDISQNTRFVDEQVTGTDVRVLRTNDEAATVQLVYGFIDENTALITQSRDQFAHIVELNKSE